MAWVRIHDGALQHRKVCGIFDPRRPFDLWIWGLSYCQSQLTDGLIPVDAIPRGTNKARQALVEKGLWEPHDIGFKVHDYLEWNDSRELVRSRQERAQARHRRWYDRVSNDVSNASIDGVSNAVSNGVDTRVSNGEPNQIEINTESNTTTALSRFERFWAAYPRKAGKGAARKWWDRKRPDDALLERMLSALSWQRTQAAWTKDGGEFIPHPATWLNHGRWDDEQPGTQAVVVKGCFHKPPCANESEHTRLYLQEQRAS